MSSVRGSIKFEDGTPAGSVKYVLIAPDGEFMNGEQSNGEGVAGRTKADGTFEYPDKPKGIGVYTMEIQGPFIGRLEGEPQSAARGSVVCKRMDGSSDFNVVVRSLTTVVNPLITLASAVVVVKKSYTNPARQLVTLTTDGPFFRPGTLTRVGTAIKFFDAAVAGNEITFNNTDNVFSGSQLSAGVQLFAEGATPSVALDDVQLTLTLTLGATPVGPPARATMTAVELTLDIFMSRTADATDPAALPQPPDPPPAPGAAVDKWFGGRFVHVQDPGNQHGRALVVVHTRPAVDFGRTLVLRNVTVAGNIVTIVDNKVQLFIPEFGDAARPNPFEFPANKADGRRFWAEGRNISAALRDTGIQLGIKDLEPDGDRVRLTVVRLSNLQALILSTPPGQARMGNGPVPNARFTTATGAAAAVADFSLNFVTNRPSFSSRARCLPQARCN